MNFEAWSAFKLFMSRGDGRHFSKSCWHCYDNYICENKEIEDAVPVWNWEEKVIPGGTNARVCTYTQMLLLRGSVLQNKNILVL